ncbi:MAG: PCRF domain-containing protein, partial [Synergistaceae bacterium]|nr:PCRF domain-containing protein [Synergistaceae bacterium]
MTVFDLPGLESRSKRLTAETLIQGFWERADASGVTRDLAGAQARIGKWNEVEAEREELETLAEMLSEADDQELAEEFYDRAAKLAKLIEAEQIYVLLDEEHDISSAIVTVHAGAGGLDSQDWCEMLYRMYLRWAESR